MAVYHFKKYNVKNNYKIGSITETNSNFRSTPIEACRLMQIYDSSGTARYLVYEDITLQPGSHTVGYLASWSDQTRLQAMSFQGSSTQYSFTIYGPPILTGTSQGSFIEDIIADERAYPAFGVQGGYYYIKMSIVSPSRPSLNVPNTWVQGKNTTVTWGASSNPQGRTISYTLERAFNGGSFTTVYNGKNLSYTEKALTSWTKVQYRIQASDGLSSSEYSTSAVRTVIPNTPPPVPTGLELTPPTGTLNSTLSWNAVVDADGDEPIQYYVQQSINGGNYTNVTDTPQKNIEILILSTWQTVQFRVRAYDGMDYGSYATTEAFTVFHNTPPTTPANIIVPEKPLNGKTITISWGASTDENTQDTITYHVERQLNSGTWSFLTDTTSLSVNTVIGAWAKVAYRVRAYDGMDYSDYRTSPVRTVITNIPPSEPASIDIVLPVKSTFSVTVNWGIATDDDAGDTIEYFLERKTDNSDWSVVLSNSTERTFTETVSVNWNTVSYRVQAHDGIEYGAYTTSDPVTVVHNTPPTMPATISAPESARDNDIIHISWGKSTDADGDTITYDLEQRVDAGTWEHLTNTQYNEYYDTVELWQTVQYRVKALAGAHTSAYKTSNVVSVTINEPPTRPASITVPALNSYEEARIRWSKSNDPNSDPITYILERRLGTGAWEVIVPETAELFYDETPSVDWKDGVKYRVKAQDNMGGSSLYRESSTIIVKHNIPPTTPILSVPPLRSGVPATITWTASEDPDGVDVTYFLQRKVNSEEIVAILDDSEELSFVDTPLDYWNTVVYKVRARDAYDFSPFSTVIIEDVQHFPDFKMKVGGEIKSSANGWVKVDGELRKMLDMWIKVNGQLKKI